VPWTQSAAGGAGVPMSVGVSTGGNTLGSTGLTGTGYVLAGINGITLSQSTDANGGTVTVSGPGAGAAFSAGASTLGNTLGSTGVTGTRYVLAGIGAVTLSQSTDGAGGTLSISAPAQSVQPESLSLGVSTGGNTLGDTTVGTGTRFVLAGAGIVTASQATAAGATTVTLSASQSVQTQGQASLGVSTGGNTLGDTGVTGTRYVFAGINNVTLSQITGPSGGTVSISGAATHAQQTGISGIAASNTTYTSGTVTITGVGGGVTVSSNTGQRVDISVAAQSIQTQGITQDQLSIGVSTGGNTAGTTTVQTGQRFVLAGGQSVTLSQSTAAGSTTVTISGASTSQSVQTQGILSAGVSTGGNTSGTTTVNTGSRLVLAGGNNITLSQSTAAGASTITISAPNLGAGAFSGGVSTMGNTAGSTGVTGTRLVVVGSDNVTLSQSTDANGGTVSIIGGGGGGAVLSMFRNLGAGVGVNSNSGQGTWLQITAFSRSLIVQPLVLQGANIFPGSMTASTFHLGPFSISESTATMSQANTVTVALGIYTLNGSSLSLLNSVSTSWGNVASTNNSTSTVGMRWLSIHSSQWSAAPSFTPGHYWLASFYNTSGIQMQRTHSLFAASIFHSTSIQGSGTMGVATVATATTMGMMPFYGRFSATRTDFPVSIGSNQLDRATNAAGLVPAFNMLAGGPQTY